MNCTTQKSLNNSEIRACLSHPLLQLGLVLDPPSRKPHEESSHTAFHCEFLWGQLRQLSGAHLVAEPFLPFWAIGWHYLHHYCTFIIILTILLLLRTPKSCRDGISTGCLSQTQLFLLMWSHGKYFLSPFSTHSRLWELNFPIVTW